MARLAPSLARAFREIDNGWPKRDRRTDGWVRYVDKQVPNSDHIPDRWGNVHAIDIDKDGIDPDVIVRQAIRQHRVTSYVIWNRGIWGYWNDYRRQRYTGTTNPHTDHIHWSIFRTDYARNWPGSWGISPIPKLTLPRYRFSSMLDELNPARGLTGRANNLRTSAVTVEAAVRSIESTMRRRRG